MRAAEVVALHADLLERTGDRRMMGFVDHLARGNLAMPAGSTAAGTGRIVHNHLKVSTPFHVEATMLTVALRRAEHDLDEDTPVAGYLPNVRHGFCVLAEPWWVIETPGETQAVHALTWGAIRSGILVTAWTDVDRDQDDVWKQVLREDVERGIDGDLIRSVQGRWVCSTVTIVTWEDVLGPSHDVGTVLDGDEHVGFLSLRRLMCVLWGMFDEVLPGAVREPAEEPDRRTRKLARRLQIPTEVEMVRLRREETPTEHPGTGAPWRVRTMISGHTRTYHRGTDREYTIWIAEHEAGPAGAPWSQRRQVKNLSR